VQGQKKACELYQPDGIPVVFDLQMEAEVLGCRLAWADEVPPSVVSHPLGNAGIDALPEYDLSKGRFPQVAEAMDRLRAEVGEEVVLYGLITGPFTLLSHLRGSEVFLDMMMNPDQVLEQMAYCSEIAKKTADFYMQHGAEVVAVVDPMTSQISPDHFQEFVAPGLNGVFDAIRDAGAFSSLFVCGDATRNLEVMCQTRCDNLSIDENIPLDLLHALALRHGKSFGGNLKLTTVLLLGTKADAMLDAIRCVDQGGTKGFILAPGCDLPHGTPEANLIAVSNMVHDEYSRQVARTTAVASVMGDFSDLKLPDYEKVRQVVLDVITLDSSACAPCLYMVDAAIRAGERANALVEVHEHKIKSREGIGMMCRLDVGNIPTICIDGVPTYKSQIPDIDTFVKAIEERYHAKTDR
jgi:MtaA/CmuA family methyltransferase